MFNNEGQIITKVKSLAGLVVELKEAIQFHKLEIEELREKIVEWERKYERIVAEQSQASDVIDNVLSKYTAEEKTAENVASSEA